jgi:hypothetical protein
MKLNFLFETQLSKEQVTDEIKSNIAQIIREKIEELFFEFRGKDRYEGTDEVLIDGTNTTLICKLKAE